MFLLYQDLLTLSNLQKQHYYVLIIPLDQELKVDLASFVKNRIEILQNQKEW